LIGIADETRIRQLIDAIVEAAIRLFVHLECDFPQRAALVAAQRGQMLDGQAGLGDDEQHARQAAGLVDRLDNQYFRNLHAQRFLCQSFKSRREGYDGEPRGRGPLYRNVTVHYEL
jgi:hypothetical protein